MLSAQKDFFMSEKVLKNWYHRDKDLFQYWEDHPEYLLKNQFTANPLLGKYHEALWSFYFHSSPHFKVLLEGEQVIVDGQTLGEVDYVVRDMESGAIYHLEVALKYYMSTQNTTDPTTWIGPNQKDHLEKKTSRLLMHQLGMIEYFPELSRARQFKGSFAILKGYLFPHIEQEKPVFPLNVSTNYGAKISWSHLSSFSSKKTNLKYQLLSKPDWLMSRKRYSEYPQKSQEEIIKDLKKQFISHPQKSFLLTVLNSSDEVEEYIMIMYESFFPKQIYNINEQ